MRVLCLLWFVAMLSGATPRRYPATGLVLAVDATRMTVTISHAPIAGYMDAMTMEFQVRDAKLLTLVRTGDIVKFVLNVDRTSSWVAGLGKTEFESAERDPSLADRLKLLDSVAGKPVKPPVDIGAEVPDFTLIDQTNRPVTLSKLRGKVVALNFVYTRCPLPDYCFRLSNNFGRLQQRFGENPDLLLLTVTFDPEHDRPEVLAQYALTWKAVPERWHFLTGDLADVDRVCAAFGVSRWRDEGLFVHSLRTVLIDRQGRLTANLEGNRFSARQLGDLVDAVLRGR